eukprot:1673874-Alexandrium_andersonii.AAC.1
MRRSLPEDAAGPPAPSRPDVHQASPRSPQRDWSLSATSELELRLNSPFTEGGSDSSSVAARSSGTSVPDTPPGRSPPVTPVSVSSGSVVGGSSPR